MASVEGGEVRQEEAEASPAAAEVGEDVSPVVDVPPDEVAEASEELPAAAEEAPEASKTARKKGMKPATQVRKRQAGWCFFSMSSHGVHPGVGGPEREPQRCCER